MLFKARSAAVYGIDAHIIDGEVDLSHRNCHVLDKEERMEDPNLNVVTGSELVRRPVDEKIQKSLDKFLYGGGHPSAQKVRNFLNGTWLGEPLHVVLTDLPVGAWTVAMAFDALDLALDRREFAWAAETSIAIGLIGAAGAAATGMTVLSE